MDYPVSTEQTRSYGVRGVFSAAGGLATLIVGNLIGVPVVGPIIGGILTVTGIYQLIRNKAENKAATYIPLALGIAGLTTIFIPKVITGFIGLAGLGLLGFGIYNIVKFIQALKSRS